MKFRLTVLVLLLTGLSAAAQQQIPNLSLDQWSKKGGAWNPWAKGEDSPTWDTANRALSMLGINGTTPEYEHVAVKGPGKAAAKIETKKVIGILVAGNLFTGHFNRVIKMSGAEMSMGCPFTGRPKSLSGYIHYKPGKIDMASDEKKHLMGTLDQASIEVSLQDWSSPEILNTTDPDFKQLRDRPHPHRIGYGIQIFHADTRGYIPFEIPIEYVNGKTPSYIVISATASHLAQHFTGSTGSVMYLDELKLNY